MVLRASYAMSGTDLRYAATPPVLGHGLFGGRMTTDSYLDSYLLPGFGQRGQMPAMFRPFAVCLPTPASTPTSYSGFDPIQLGFGQI
eukprot:297841-Rhodomonas_salina.4